MSVRAHYVVHGPGKVEPRDGISSREFARTDRDFLHLCRMTPAIAPNARQASKYRNGKGSAYSRRWAL